MCSLQAWPDKTIVGMLHVPPLPGSPASQFSLEAIEDLVLQDALALVDAGVHGLLLENFGDSPFFPARVPAVTVAAMTRLARRVKQSYEIPLGQCAAK